MSKKQRNKFLLSIKYLLELVLFAVLFLLFRLLGLHISSNLCGLLGRCFGKYLSISEVARRNLVTAFPDYDEDHINRLVTDMWDNIARNIAEFAHICTLPKNTVLSIVDDTEISRLKKLLRGHKTAIFISAHYGDWELLPKLLYEHDMPIDLIYRPANNPLVDYLMKLMRTCYVKNYIAKGSKQSLRILLKLAGSSGNFIGVLADQKAREGIAIDFFGKTAMATTTAVELAIKFELPVIPMRILRLGSSCKFKVQIGEPLDCSSKNTELIVVNYHKLLEEWITDSPEQWLWIHRRWG
jgi:KDO2-lipid IV(A) lauroyltransferase